MPTERREASRRIRKERNNPSALLAIRVARVLRWQWSGWRLEALGWFSFGTNR